MKHGSIHYSLKYIQGAYVIKRTQYLRGQVIADKKKPRQNDWQNLQDLILDEILLSTNKRDDLSHLRLRVAWFDVAIHAWSTA